MAQGIAALRATLPIKKLLRQFVVLESFLRKKNLQVLFFKNSRNSKKYDSNRPLSPE